MSAIFALLYINHTTYFDYIDFTNIHFYHVHKYDKVYVCEYTFICPLKSEAKGLFFSTRTKKFLYAYKKYFLREAEIFSSRTNIVFIAM